MQARTRLRSMLAYQQPVRSIVHAALVPEVQHALNNWPLTDKCVLVGGIALSFYCTPRYTQDIDLLYLSAEDKPNDVPGFKRLRTHAFHENKTHVEVETLTPEFLGLSHALVTKVFHTAETHGKWKVASREGIVALKLQRSSLQDKADIKALSKGRTLDMRDWPLTEAQQDSLADILAHP